MNVIADSKNSAGGGGGNEHNHGSNNQQKQVHDDDDKLTHTTTTSTITINTTRTPSPPPPSSIIVAEVQRMIPSLQLIEDFFRKIYDKSQLESECIIMTIIYLERLIVKTKGKLRIHNDNWKPM